MPRDIIQEFKDRIGSELDEVTYTEEMYDQMIDDVYEADLRKVGGPFAHMQPSRILKEVDPIAYRVGMSDEESSYFSDNDDYVEVDGSYYKKDEVTALRAEMMSELEDSVVNLEGEEDDDYAARLDELHDLLETLSNHSF